MTRCRQILASSWLVASTALFAWCIWSGISAWQYFSFVSGALKSSILGGAISLGVALGAVYALRNIPSGGAILKVGAWVVLVYVLAYFFLGGLHDAPGQLPGVIAVVVLAPLTLYCFRKGSVRPNTSLERSRER